MNEQKLAAPAMLQPGDKVRVGTDDRGAAPVRIEVGVATDIGRVRERNEDALLVDPPLYAVADGMGGHRGGQVASQLALEAMEELATGAGGSLADQVRRANRAVLDRSVEDERLAGMGTTLTAARIDGGSALLAHVGDSPRVPAAGRGPPAAHDATTPWSPGW